jgi:hypothetical protein
MSGPSNTFDMSRMAMGGFGQMLDSVEFVKRAWSSMNLPSTLVPTVDIDELDKRIADLKAVEQWLNLNLGMLRGTIQGLEIQRGTLAAVKAFGASMGNMAMPGAGAGAPQAAPARPQPAPARAAAEPPAPPRDTASPMRDPGTPARDGATEAAGAPAPAPATPTMPGINPGTWWNLLQQNFNQVAEAAMSGVGLQGAAAGAALKVAADTATRARAAGAPARAGAAPKAPATKKRAPAGKRAAPARPRRTAD